GASRSTRPCSHSRNRVAATKVLVLLAMRIGVSGVRPLLAAVLSPAGPVTKIAVGCSSGASCAASAWDCGSAGSACAMAGEARTRAKASFSMLADEHGAGLAVKLMRLHEPATLAEPRRDPH